MTSQKGRSSAEKKAIRNRNGIHIDSKNYFYGVQNQIFAPNKITYLCHQRSKRGKKCKELIC